MTKINEKEGLEKITDAVSGIVMGIGILGLMIIALPFVIYANTKLEKRFKKSMGALLMTKSIIERDLRERREIEQGIIKLY